MINKQTTLDLNGPILSFTTHPTSVSVANAGIVTFVGIATATFPSQSPTNPATNTGIISYQWYADGYGQLTDGSYLGATLSGSGTTTLTMSNIVSPNGNGAKFYVQADYIASAYNTTGITEVGSGRSTGNAVNEPINSNTATLTVYPLVSISSQPSSQTVSQTSTTTFSIVASSNDGGSVAYRWHINGVALNNGSNSISGSTFTVSGATSSTLSISGTAIGNYNVTATVSNSIASNSPLTSNTAVFSVVSARKIINLEKVNQTGGSSASLSSTNVFFESFTLAAEAGDPAGTIYSFYAPETDIDVLVELYGCVGVSNGGYRGGEGGVSTIRMTLQKNVEYVVSALPQASGGAAVFLWRKSSLIASVGGGGNAGNGGNGGDGGGVNVAGGNGFGRGAGAGGRLYLPGTLPTTSGIFGSVSGQVAIYSEDSRASAPDGGRVLGCSKGGTAPGNSYWLNRGFSPCQDVGTVQLVNADGYIVPNTAFINRGHKFGYAIRQTAGLGLNGGGNGANGATGGQGGNGGGGGGGGSGYTDGSVTIVSTRQGGHTGLAKVIIRNVA
jgi:hypothetical protein